ncbi:MAG TPA: glycine cleavage system protein GcvH [Thermoplasmatales archaeon]|nr:glycine cleavage system protein GcvH [Thermoplasmatales archaeon]
MEIRDNLLYTKTHEWVLKKNGFARIGITDHAQESLTDIVFVEFPEKGERFKKGEKIVTLESVKSVSEVFAPFTGKILNLNEKLNDEPGLINSSPYDEGWIVEMEIENEEELEDLMPPGEYRKIISKDL